MKSASSHRLVTFLVALRAGTAKKNMVVTRV